MNIQLFTLPHFCRVALFISYAAKGKHNKIKGLNIRLAGSDVAFNSNAVMAFSI